MTPEQSQPHNEALVIQKSSPLPWVLLVLVLLGAGALAWWLNEQLHAKQNELAAAQEKSQQSLLKLGAVEATNAELTTQLERAKTENSELASAKEELSRDVAEKSDELAKLKSTYDTLHDKMKSEIAKGDIQLVQAGGKLRVALVDKILFDSGEAQISKRGEEVLQRVGAVLATIDDKQIQVSGHTDDSPISDRLVAQYPTNWELSSARAINVVRFLSEKAGVPGKRLVASGYSQFHPIADNAKPLGRARNRRIEILLTPLNDGSANGKAQLSTLAPATPAKASPSKGVVASAKTPPTKSPPAKTPAKKSSGTSNNSGKVVAKRK
jgi:chemotaxis protein MotB